jgi:hypothetical protein
MNAPAQTREKSGTTDACKVVILYDGPEARSKAMQVCNHLVLQFEGDLAFDFNWWRMDFLKEAGLADLSAEEAGLADILIICANPAGQLASHVKKWFGSWARKHSEHLGILVDITKASAREWNEVRATKQFLREAARRAGFDYLETSYVPLESLIRPFEPGREAAAAPFPGPEYFANEEPPAPEHSGLNE